MSLISMVGNAALGAIRAFGVTPEPSETYPPSLDPFVPEFAQIEIGDNAQLEALAMPLPLTLGRQVRIFDNPNLTAIDLGSLEKLDQLAIRNNASLAQVAMPALEAVDDLRVVNNPSFAGSSFANVKTFSTDMQGNLD